MELNLPESSLLREPHKIEGPMTEARESFYELAKSKIKYLSSQEIAEWHKKMSGRENYVTTISYIVSHNSDVTEDGDFEKWVNALEIVVNKDVATFNGEDFSDCMPFIIEHDIYEAWLSAKKGAATSLDVAKKHLLARRREFLMAEEQGLGEKLHKFQMAVNSGNKKEYDEALNYARRRVANSRKKEE